MNFLAHTYLSFGEPGLIVGNYLGDFVTNKVMKTLPLEVQSGVKLHRFIDSYTDRHPVVKEGTRMLHSTMGKYAPVVLDIYFDYLLSKFWTDYEEVSLRAYCTHSYQALTEYQSIMPSVISDRAERMIADRWLENYQHYIGLERVFGFLSRRARFKSNLAHAPEVLKELEDPLGKIFNRFFPDLEHYARAEVMKSALDPAGKTSEKPLGHTS